MRNPSVIALSFLAFLAACGTPQEQCIRANTRDLQVLERLIAETEANLARGYAIEEYITTTPRWLPCSVQPRPAADKPAPPPAMCLETVETVQTRPKAIDLGAERAKLASMQAKRAELARAAQKVIAECRALHPE